MKRFDCNQLSLRKKKWILVELIESTTGHLEAMDRMNSEFKSSEAFSVHYRTFWTILTCTQFLSSEWTHATFIVVDISEAYVWHSPNALKTPKLNIFLIFQWLLLVLMWRVSQQTFYFSCHRTAHRPHENLISSSTFSAFSHDSFLSCRK